MGVPEYTRKAIAKYQSKFERVNINFPDGTKERIKTMTGESVNGYVNRLVKEDLERLESGHIARTTPEPEKELDFSAYDKKKAEAASLQTMEELQEYVLMRQAEEAKRKAENPEPMEDIPIKPEKPKDPPPDDDALTKKLNEIRDRRKQAQEGNS